jgi:hypothetical protein
MSSDTVEFVGALVSGRRLSEPEMSGSQPEFEPRVNCSGWTDCRSPSPKKVTCGGQVPHRDFLANEDRTGCVHCRPKGVGTIREHRARENSLNHPNQS